MKKIERVLAFDQAANQSGWAFFENQKPVKYGIINPSDCLDEEKLNNTLKELEKIENKEK